MTWNVAITALGAVFVFAAIISMLGFGKEAKYGGPLDSYLLAGGKLGRVPVVNLLLSSSFGVNTMLYQGYLGATVGFWGLVVQAAWAAGFFLLIPHSDLLKKYRGLHDYLGVNFGAATRVVAAVFSLIGITIFLGWETSIGRDAFKGMFDITFSNSSLKSSAGAEWIVIGIVVGCLLYTLVGGLRGNAIANTAQNLLKIIGFSVVTYLLGTAFFAQSGAVFWSSFFPPLSAMEANLGLWGLITSIVFGCVWQFIDMSTWQSLTASANSPVEDIRWNLKWSGYLVFITPGVLGTIFGVFLSNIPDGASNVLVTASKIISSSGAWVSFLFAASIMASVMSLIDGLFLASTYTFIVDFFYPKKRLFELDADERHAEKILFFARLALLVIAFASIWLVPMAIKYVGHDKDLFFFSFIVVIAQLALFGPIIVGICCGSERTNGNARSVAMWMPIIVSGVLGFTIAFIGAANGVKWMTDGAGTFTLLISLLVALIVWATRNRK